MKLDKDGNPIEDPNDDPNDDPIIEDEDPIDDEPAEIEVDLEDEDAKAAREEKDRNKAFASMRIENKELKDSVNKLTETVQQLQGRPSTPVSAAPIPTGIPQTDEEWDALADKDWKKAVDLRSIQNAKTIMQQQQQVSKADKTMNESKQKVLATHPELNDNNSEKSRIFLNILDENPDYLTHPKGPIYAMRDMEDYMENTLGYKRSEIRTAEKKGAEREASRQNRIVLNKGSGRMADSGGNKVVLSKDEMEFCKFQGIDPKEYAKNKQKLSKSNAKDGVTI